MYSQIVCTLIQRLKNYGLRDQTCRPILCFYWIYILLGLLKESTGHFGVTTIATPTINYCVAESFHEHVFTPTRMCCFARSQDLGARAKGKHYQKAKN